MLVLQASCVSEQASSHLFANSSCVAAFSIVVEVADCPNAKRPHDFSVSIFPATRLRLYVQGAASVEITYSGFAEIL